MFAFSPMRNSYHTNIIFGERCHNEHALKPCHLWCHGHFWFVTDVLSCLLAIENFILDSSLLECDALLLGKWFAPL